MTVLMTSEMPGTTNEVYDRLAANLLPILQKTDGFIMHAAGPVDGGYRVTELWESEQAHAAWFDVHVRPSMPPDAPAPRVTIQPLTNVTTR